MNHEVNSKHYFVFKRILDLLISVVLLIFAFPVLVILSILVLIFIGKPVLFKQTRSGMNGDNFTIYKFRTMSLERDLSGNLLSDEFRMTTLGSFLRKSSLDELPQLYNVLKGDLSLVGPRPLLPEYNDLYSAFQKRRLSVVPGITGWAQINGRNLLSWDERFNLDVWYVDNKSLLLDLKILILTIKKICIREGVSAVGEVTMTKFTGSSHDFLGK